MDVKAKYLLLSLLDNFVLVCNEYHLQYYLAGGSVIGAVRHKGFIPWDDDIDVHMPRADYERLQTLPDDVWGNNMQLATWRKTKNYTYDFLKLELTNTTVIERLHPDYVGGIFLDIFPLDFITDDKTSIETFEHEYKQIASKYIRCTINNDNECNSIFDLIILKIERMCYSHKRQMEKWERLATSFGKNLNKVCHSHGYFYYKGGMNANWFGEGVELEFEGRKVKVPTNYDAYLRHVFGDYLTLPPMDARKGHDFLYVNYDRRITTIEANKIFKKLHKEYAYIFSLKREIKYFIRNICQINI